MITLRELAELGSQMRQAQRAYGSDRSPEAMRECRQLQACFDAAVQSVLDGSSIDRSRMTSQFERLMYRIVRNGRSRGWTDEEIKSRLHRVIPSEYCDVNGW